MPPKTNFTEEARKSPLSTVLTGSLLILQTHTHETPTFEPEHFAVSATETSYRVRLTSTLELVGDSSTSQDTVILIYPECSGSLMSLLETLLENSDAFFKELLAEPLATSVLNSCCQLKSDLSLHRSLHRDTEMSFRPCHFQLTVSQPTLLILCLAACILQYHCLTKIVELLQLKTPVPPEDYSGPMGALIETSCMARGLTAHIHMLARTT